MTRVTIQTNIVVASWKGIWNSGTTYALGDGVTASDGHNYVSLGAGNLNHNPVGDGGVHWSDLLPSSVVTVSSSSTIQVRNTRFALRDWVSVADYLTPGGGVGSSNDTADMTAAIAACPIGGNLLIPQGYYQINNDLVLPKPITIWGVGLAPSGVNVGSQIVQALNGKHIFDIQSDYVGIHNLTLTAVGFTPTSGAGVHKTSGLFTVLDNVAVSAMWNGVEFVIGGGDAINDLRVVDPKNYGVYVRNTASADTGDSTLTDAYISSSTNTAAGVRWESSGGLKMNGGKIIGFQRGYDAMIADGAITSNLQITGVGMENQTLNVIRIGRLGTTGFLKRASITGCLLGGYLLTTTAVTATTNSTTAVTAISPAQTVGDVLPVSGSGIPGGTTILITGAGTTGTLSNAATSSASGVALTLGRDVVQIGGTTGTPPGISVITLTGGTVEGNANTTGLHFQSGGSGMMVAGVAFASHSVGIQNDGVGLGHKGNAYFTVTTPYAGAGTLATID